MFFSEVVDEVISILARPDREDEIKVAINAILHKTLLKANFAFDLVESTINIDPTLYGDTIDYSAEVTRFRKFKYVKPYGARRYLKSIDSDKVFTPGEVMQKERYYIAGTNLTYILANLAPSLEIGYYQYPDILANPNDTHWFLDKAPYCIIDLTAARMMRSIGDDTSAKAYEQSGKELFEVAKRDFEDGVLPEAR